MSRRRTLDPAAVVQAAAALADEVGIEQLTLAQLAEQLGVKIPSLYNHISGLAGLRRELALLGVRELLKRMGRAAIGKAADDAIAAIAQAYRGFAHEHPGLYAATIRAPDPNDIELLATSRELLDLVLTVLAPYSLRDDVALHTVRGLRSIVHGFVSLEATGGFGMPLDLDESYRRLVQVFIDGLRGEGVRG
jgi:AcrR family transcriptional regulator